MQNCAETAGRVRWHNPHAMTPHPAQLIFLPGLAADSRMWRQQLAALPPHWQASVTDVHFQHDSVEQMAMALLQQHPGTLVLCGASMGGIIAMETVRQAPQRVRGLALLGTNARPETDAMRRLREDAIRMFEAGRAAELLRANAALAFHPSRTNDRVLIQSYLDFCLAAGSAPLVRQNRAIMARPDARLHLGQVRCPTLVLCGDTDQLTPPACSHEIAQLIVHARLQLIDRCGHMLTMERPDAVNAALLDWLDTLS